MSERKPLILVVEDMEYLALLAAQLLNQQGYETLIAYTAGEARALVRNHRPDLYVLDVELPDGNGFSLCEELRKESDAPVLFLTGKSEIENKITGLGVGGDYYMTKPYDPDEFIAVVNSLARRMKQTQKKLTEATLIERGPITINIHDRTVTVGGQDAELSQKEFAVLLMLVENEDKELPYDTIFEAVWHAPMYNDSSALRQQVSRLKKKLGEENTDDFSIINKSGKGYTFTLT
jgi:DNA-binding response OmpR family regulator